ncbi:hypothetical protein [Flavobacterium hydatis]|jgi:hypothetical protein|uniref:DUF4369 domain-containing protein n=1 Tax=Flavobacterium hydatis TaxID=991 RepID=A0A086AGZ2_FLAHY|nr:hypothetical protein [Flavobacterium hydatis]KFF15956.1 hypothetical protein IW20_12660 [Flavobacterium hydatis]OXA92597.1 hypothetical protein B0A62_15285 [Flavobacterium hydatis]
MKQTYKNLLIFLLFFSTPIYAQNQECIIYFKEGDSIEGFGLIRNNKIKFKISKDSETDSWDFENVYKIKFIGIDIVQTYEYLKLNSSGNPKLVELIVDGEVNLYRMEKAQDFINPKLKKTAAPNQNITSLPNYSYFTEQTKDLYYLKRKNNQYATHINIGILSNWKKISTSYFSDCDILVKKIKDNKFSSNQIKEIVEYYNDICYEQ